ncbi:MAG: VanZ family protein [Chitinophagales bacterium]
MPYRLLVVIWMSAMFVLSILPSGNVSKISFLDIPHIDKLVHAFCHFIIIILLLLDSQSRLYHYKNSIIIAISISFLYGFLIEIIQKLFITTRFFEISDIFANIIGSFTALFIFHFFFSPQKLKKI